MSFYIQRFSFLPCNPGTMYLIPYSINRRSYAFNLGAMYLTTCSRFFSASPAVYSTSILAQTFLSYPANHTTTYVILCSRRSHPPLWSRINTCHTLSLMFARIYMTPAHRTLLYVPDVVFYTLPRGKVLHLHGTPLLRSRPRSSCHVLNGKSFPTCSGSLPNTASAASRRTGVLLGQTLRSISSLYMKEASQQRLPANHASHTFSCTQSAGLVTWQSLLRTSKPKQQSINSSCALRSIVSSGQHVTRTKCSHLGCSQHNGLRASMRRSRDAFLNALPLLN
jgi:hypothetical protein